MVSLFFSFLLPIFHFLYYALRHQHYAAKTVIAATLFSMITAGGWWEYG